MPKIRGKFTPLFSELGEDSRWLLECNDRQKFLFILVLMTIYECNNSAPLDPRYYKVRYALAHRLHTIRTDLAHLNAKFPKLLCKDKKLSLCNYRGYEDRVADKTPKNKNKKENKKEKENYEKIYTPSFERFWKAYPRKVGKGAAAIAFEKMRPQNGLLENMISAIEKQRGWPQWKEHGGKYIPNPATWLNQRRWEDEHDREETDEEKGQRILEQLRSE